MPDPRESLLLPREPRGGRPKEGQALSPKELENKIDALRQEMQEHEGEFVLLVVRHWEQYGFDMPEEQTPYGLDEDFYLGVIAPPYIQEIDPHIVVGTEKCVHFDKRRPHLGIEKRTGILNPYEAWRWNLERDSFAQPTNHPFQKNKKLLEIVVGDKKVVEWVSKEITVGNMTIEDLELQEKLLEISGKEKRRYFNRNLFLAFRNMAQALGRNLILSQELSGQAEEELKQEKTQILKTIDELLKEEDRLTGRIKRVFDFAKESGTLNVDGGITPVENEDDARVITFGDREQLKKVRNRIESSLKEAFDMGMHETEMAVEVEIRPGHKEILDVPRFIRGLCEKYEIPLPRNKDNLQ